MRWKPSPQAVDRIAFALTNTWRYHFFGMDHVRAACRSSPQRTAMFILWHQNILLLAGMLRPNGMRLAPMLSLSRDGALLATHLEHRGMRLVRGSSHRGGAAGAKEMMRAVEDGFHPVIVIDGPKGPRMTTKSGPIILARNLGLPIVPLAARATHEFHLPSWDRLRVPPPRAHIATAFGEPIWPSDEDPELTQRTLATRLHDVEAEAARHVRQGNCYPAARHLQWLGDRNPPPAGE